MENEIERLKKDLPEFSLLTIEEENLSEESSIQRLYLAETSEIEKGYKLTKILRELIERRKNLLKDKKKLNEERKKLKKKEKELDEEREEIEEEKKKIIEEGKQLSQKSNKLQQINKLKKKKIN